MRTLGPVAALAAIAILSVMVPAAGAVPPDAPTIGGPSGTINDPAPSFTFEAAGATAYFCSVDSPGPAAPCASPYTSTTLADGPHTFYVAASDGVDTGPAASRAFIVDTTPPPVPTLGGPSGTINDATPTFTFSSAGATAYMCAVDDAAPAAACTSPHTTTTLADGPHTFYATATDEAGNTSAAAPRAFTVDTTPPPVPTLGGPSGTINDATPTFTFSSAGATAYKCAVDDAAPAAACTSPHTTTTLADGPHAFYATATDEAGNTSAAAPRAFTVDRTPPETSITTNVPATVATAVISIAFTATGAPASFECKLDSGPFSACSSPAGLTNLTDGSHTFSVRASDAAGNTDSTPATTAWSVDTTPPALTGPGNLTVEADGPAGTRVSFAVTASDGGLPLLPGAVGCSSASAAQFGLGTTRVTCSATDAAGNAGTTSFTISVVDTTAPSINAPEASFTATSARGILRSDRDIAAYLAKITATDLVSATTLTTTMPDTLPIGSTRIVVTAKDAAGNQAQKAVTLTVLPLGNQAPPPDFAPPGPVRRAKAQTGDHRIVLTWALPTDADLASVRVVRSKVGTTLTRTVYRGLGTRLTDGGLQNDAAYRYTLVATDRAGNSSRSIVVSATPKARLLASPAAKARITRPPLLRWAPVSSASYFNVQLYRNGAKILSAWPGRARLQLTSRWNYGKRGFSLEPGVYTWYVWPGLGRRAEARYGEPLGRSSFVVTARKKR